MTKEGVFIALCQVVHDMLRKAAAELMMRLLQMEYRVEIAYRLFAVFLLLEP